MSNLVEEFWNRVLMVKYSLAVNNRGEPQDLHIHAGGILIVVFEVVVIEEILKRNKI